MDYFAETFGINTGSKTKDSYVYIRGNMRISVLTSRLIRIEKQNEGDFCDLPTQSVLCRDFDSPSFFVASNGDSFALKTDDVSFVFNNKCELKAVTLNGCDTVTDFYGSNLKGTRRTLDMTHGKVKLGDGVVSRNGVAVFDDSESLVLLPDGSVKPRKEVLGRKSNGTDVYIFAYGHDYIAAVRDLYKLTGNTPLLPRFVLGNWWSRYKAYTQQEYLDLMSRFKKAEIPITVATVDMDWHWVDVDKRFGAAAMPARKNMGVINKFMSFFQSPGWTGYSWNTELFPDYKKFLKTLKDDGLKVTVNLHPADGVRFFEDMYKEFAGFMGIDPESGETIEFDITDKKFVEGYFKYLHHGYENDGVDFWWIDWQQGSNTKVEGLDPLWALNHYHSLDSARNGRRPLILSRYAGVGSHRYPLGFSGDTGVFWSSLKFQPYFTATASNIGYSWWSHDIGGHNMGFRDDELYIRWVQYGVFSPIMRLHSTNNEFAGKEPWKYSREAEITATESLRFRHRLIPYLYTMNRRTNKDGRALTEPMYYHYPEEDEAYNVPNEYFFGSELIVAPVTSPVSKKLRMACSEVWLPEGRYTDIFTGRIYKGGRKIKMYRDTSSIPVLAKEGSIIPLAVNDRTGDWKNPEEMELLIYSGNGEFTLYEDDGETTAYEKDEYCETLFKTEKDGTDLVFTISNHGGDTGVVPENRKYLLSFKDIASYEKVRVMINGKWAKYGEIKYNEGTGIAVELRPGDRLKVVLKEITLRKNPEKKELLCDLLSKVQGSNDIKAILLGRCLKEGFGGKGIVDKDLASAMEEISAME